MTTDRWPVLVVKGLLAGAFATIVLTLLLLVGRWLLGVSPPPEALPDRFAPTLDIDTFFSLFERFGGYNGLKRFGIRSGTIGLVSVGLLIGLVYAVLAGRERSSGAVPRRGFLFVAIALVMMWVGSLAVLSPVLAANYRGLSPSRAIVVSSVWLLIAYLGYGLSLIGSHRFMSRPPPTASAEAAPSGAIGRRAVVVAAGGAALSVPTVAIFRRLWSRTTFSYDGTVYSGPGVEPIAPNDKFYTVTKNVIDPDVTKRLWGLEVNGVVANPRRYSFDDLSAMAAVDQETTLMCISNQIGAGLFSNAVWRGVPMRTLLEAAGPEPEAMEVRLYAADGYTDTFAIEKAMNPATLVAFAMNGEPLPRIHGYPVRIIVPGLFGEKNVKWVTRIEVADYDAKGFYEQQGWGPSFEVPTRCDLFSPRWVRAGGRDSFVEPFRSGQEIEIRGRAFAGARGIRLVEVSLDDGETWQPVTVDYPGTDLTWTFWHYRWRPTRAGEYVITSRATDDTGALQTEAVRGIAPEGATGRHRVRAEVAGAE